MTPEQFKLAMSLFDRACDLHDADRAAFLDSRCAGDPTLRAEVETLLAADARPLKQVCEIGGGALLLAAHIHNEPASSRVSHQACAIPTLAGHYRILRVIGEGGMGIVYEAQQARPRRTVALKAIRPGLVSERMLQRFMNEVNILGRLQHPGIAQIYDAGAADADHADQAYFAMELVRGEPLTDYVARRNMATAARIELLIKVCDAVQHAHQRGVIHRDLKPANILVVDDMGVREGGNVRMKQDVDRSNVPTFRCSHAPQPKILDFGVARMCDADSHDAITRTGAGELLGTLPYMSPEQVSGRADLIDTRTDVYSLGVLFFQILVHDLPHDLRGKPLAEAIRIIRDESPRPLGAFRSSFRGDIETIAAHALAKDPEQRYQSAADLAADLRRYLLGEPIAARRHSTVYIVRRQLWRHRVMASAVALFLLGLVSFGLYERRQADQFRVLAENESAARQDARRLADRLAAGMTVANIERGRLLGRSGNLGQAEALIWPEHLRDPDSRYSHWALWEIYSRQPCAAAIHAHTGDVFAAEFSPDGRVLATGGADANVCLWEVGSWRRLATLSRHTAAVQAINFSPDSRRLASTGLDGTVVVWQVDKREVEHIFDKRPGRYNSVQISPDGRHVAAAARREGRIEFWDLATGQHARTLRTQAATVARICYSPLGEVFIGTTDAALRIWVNQTQMAAEPLAVLTANSNIGALVFSRDGRTLYVGGERMVEVCDSTAARFVDRFAISNGRVRGLALSDDGRNLAIGGWWGVELWDVERHSRTRSFPMDEQVQGFDQTPDGRFIACGDRTGGLRIWEVEPAGALTRLNTGAAVASMHPNGRMIAVAARDGSVQLWDREGGARIGTLQDPQAMRRSLHFSPDGEMVASGAADGTLQIWNTSDCSALAPILGHHDITSDALAWRPDSSAVASTRSDGAVQVFELPSQRLLGTIPSVGAEILSVQFSPDGHTVATIARDNRVWLWRENGEPLAELATIDQPWTVTFQPQGHLLATGAWNSKIELWDLATLERVGLLEGHAGTVWAVRFSPTDPAILASASADGTVRLWDALERRCLLTLEDLCGSEALSLSFDREGRWLVCGGSGGTTVVWDLTYFDRHIAGNLERQSERRAENLHGTFQADEPRAQAAGVHTR